MSILISELVKKYNLTEDIDFINEKPFDVFARATTFIDGKKCIFISNIKYADSIHESVSMVITTREIARELSGDIGVCACDNPRGLFFELLSNYDKADGMIRFDTKIGRNCVISETSVISPYNVIIGDNVKIGDYVVIQPNTTIGDNVTIQTGAKIAEQDFNVYNYQGITKQVYHSGKVMIGSNVLISPGVLVGQALYSYGRTSIGDNSFIGAGTSIGHNTAIGPGCEICGNSIIGGFCSIGKSSKLFMAVTVANALNIGENVTINVGSVVIRNIKDGMTVFGNPAREILAPRS